jgi:ketosteroid isomerase-like protein
MSEISTTEQNRDVIRRLYAAVQSGDGPAIAELIADDCVLSQSGGHPVPGTWNGREQMMQGMSQVFAAIHNTGVTVHEIVADGPSRVIGLVDALGRDARGETYEMPVAECFKLRDGKVIEIRPFYWDQLRLHAIASAIA